VVFLVLIVPYVPHPAGSSRDTGSGASLFVPSASNGVAANISDGSAITRTLHSGLDSVLTDRISYNGSAGGNRSYTIALRATVALPTVGVNLETFPLIQWGYPRQLPGGDDSLPPLNLWSWTIHQDGRIDSSRWKVTSWEGMFNRTTSWTNGTWVLEGSTSPKIGVTVDPTTPGGTTTPMIGVVTNFPGVNGALPTGDPDYEHLAAGVHPGLVRFGADTAQVSYVWNASSNEAKYNFTHFDELMNFSSQLGARVILSLPAGTWGDGNLLPTGMPLNTTIRVDGPSGRGYFPSTSAYESYLDGIVNHTIALHQNIAYWSIGNEVPTTGPREVTAFTAVFNAAVRAIHMKLTSALVGTDVMTNLTFESYFADNARKVGFLSFHYYPSLGICVQGGQYCPPAGPPNGSTSRVMFNHAAYSLIGRNYGPRAAQLLWHNVTGRWIPILNTETNLNAVGGGAGSLATGTDPRIQTLFGASWVDSLLIDGAGQNVSGLVYFTLSSGANASNTITGPYGGWGFGLTSEGAADNDVRYAPYYALQLWSAAIPAGEGSVSSTVSVPNLVEAYSAFNGMNLSVVLVNRVNVPVSIAVSLLYGGYNCSSVSTLDLRSYQEVYSPTDHTTVVVKSGYSTAFPITGAPVTIDGYGVAVIHYVPTGKGSSSGVGSDSRTTSDHSTGSVILIGTLPAVEVRSGSGSVDLGIAPPAPMERPQSRLSMDFP